MENCIFCRIVKGEIPAAKIYEDDLVFAFLDIAPINYGQRNGIVCKRSNKYQKNSQ